MKIDKRYKPELIVSKDKCRYVLNYSYLLGDYLYATDGRKMVKIKVDLDEGDKDGFIPALAYTLGRPVLKKTEPLQILCNGTVKVKAKDGIVNIEREVQGEFPICENAIPKEKPIYKIGLNAKLLKQLADSMGTYGVILEIIAEDKAIIVKPLSQDCNVSGLLMPMRIT